MDTGSKGGPHPIPDGELHRADALGKKKKRNAHIWYVLHVDGVPAGAFADMQLGIEDTWTAKKPSSMTAEEKQSLQARMKETARKRKEAQAKLNAAAAEAAALVMKASVKASPDHPYLAKKGLPVFPGLRMLTDNIKYVIDPEEEKPRVARSGNLVVPVYSPEKCLVGVQLIQADGQKFFMKGTPKEGNYHSVGKPPEKDDAFIFIAEGYATAARVHQATNSLCIAAFDAGNLLPVGKAIRAKFPKARLVYAADNDRMTTKPVENPGVTRAKEAAEATGGIVAVPEFAEGDIDNTDFDDLARLNGLDAVKTALREAISPKPKMVDPIPDQDAPPPMEYDGPDGSEYLPDASAEANSGGDRQHPLADFGSPHFRCLGVDGTTYFFQPANVAQVIELPGSALKMANLVRLAPLQWWEFEFPGKSKEGGVSWPEAINACVQACKFRRKFVPHNLVRGRGAWFESQTAVFHSGESLIVDGIRKDIANHKSRYVYDEGDNIDVAIERPASTEESRRFLTLCKSLRWQSALSGYLLAGFCVVAPVCGFLHWRPHLWINGPAGSGKSTVMDRIVKAALASTAHSVVGNTTEAGIRGALGMDALPIIFDESEPKDMQSQARIRSILDLARVAASESDGLILKGTSSQKTRGYRARSMFVFASINTQIEGFADESRFTQLTLAPPPMGSPEEEEASRKAWEKLVSDIVELMTPEFAARLLARTIQNLPTLRQYVSVFTAAATIHLGAQRLGDQLGPLLAGAYILNTTKPVTVETALEWIRGNDWSDHTARDGARDAERFLQHITGHMVRHNTPEGGTWERTVGELIEIAAYDDTYIEQVNNVTVEQVVNKRKHSAIQSLARLGIKVVGEFPDIKCEITTSAESFRSLLKNTEWAGTKWRKILETIPGAYPGKGNRYFANGVNTPFIVVPVDAVRSYKIEDTM
ncbi:hypothetical protein F9K91_05090 [Brucella tritici]|uniref:Toprim domain-containing protein n=1 Tax=Brucella tritici TaxID=94626 RepID=A0A833FRK1_9HYPH|nr:toprim domain-containing protein [Brucella tritici]KAB2666559.1 hypothetical protein F9K91_05090 [Brucella tritici]